MIRVQLVLVPPETPGHFAELGEGLTPPLGILSVAAYLRKNFSPVDIRVTDGLLAGFSGTVDSVKEWNPDIVGLSFNTPVAESGYKLFNALRELLPNTLLVAGGAHATALPQEVLSRSAADLVVVGEGELPFLDIVRAVASGATRSLEGFETIGNLVFRKNGTIQANAIRSYIENLDDLPFPARDLVDMSKYSGWYLTQKKPETTLLFSRGCAYHCVFCSNKVWNCSQPTLRFRSPKNIVDEIEHLRDTYGIREVFDNSDEFNNSLQHAKAVCREMITRKLGMPWKTQLRAWPLDEELVRLMTESGCWYVHLGIESANQETLDGVGKKITIERVEESCRLLKKYKIKVLGLFMLFSVWEEKGQAAFEDAEASERTLAFAGKLIRKGLIAYMGWSITMPYPGSPLYDIAKKHDLIKPGLDGEWDAWLREEFSVLKLPGVSDKAIARLKSRGTFWRALAMVRSGGFGFSDLGYMLRKGARVVVNEIFARFK